MYATLWHCGLRFYYCPWLLTQALWHYDHQHFTLSTVPPPRQIGLRSRCRTLWLIWRGFGAVFRRRWQSYSGCWFRCGRITWFGAARARVFVVGRTVVADCRWWKHGSVQLGWRRRDAAGLRHVWTSVGRQQTSWRRLATRDEVFQPVDACVLIVVYPPDQRVWNITENITVIHWTTHDMGSCEARRSGPVLKMGGLAMMRWEYSKFTRSHWSPSKIAWRLFAGCW